MQECQSPSTNPPVSKIHRPTVFPSYPQYDYTTVLNWLEPAPSMTVWCLRGLQKWLLMSMCKGYCTTLPTATSSINFPSPPRKPVQRFMPAPAGNRNCWSCAFCQHHTPPPPLFFFLYSPHTDFSVEVSSQVQLVIKLSTELKHFVNIQKQWRGQATGLQTVKSKPLYFSWPFSFLTCYICWAFTCLLALRIWKSPWKIVHNQAPVIMTPVRPNYWDKFMCFGSCWSLVLAPKIGP